MGQVTIKVLNKKETENENKMLNKKEIEIYSFQVEDIKPKKEKLEEIPFKEAFGGKILHSSLSDSEKLIYYANHTILQGFMEAYENHLPMTLSPDIFWQIILQCVATHIDRNSELMRESIVNFDGKKELNFIRYNMTPETATKNDWEGIINELVSKIEENVGSELINSLKPEFSTTTKDIAISDNVMIMCGMKTYFNYSGFMTMCGVSRIYLEGTIEDWEKLKEKIQLLRKLELSHWIDIIEKHIQKIIESRKGNIDIEFWKNFIRKPTTSGVSGRGSIDPLHSIDGWIVDFFPYSPKGSDRSPFTNWYKEIRNKSELPDEILSCPLKVTVVENIGAPNGVDYELELHSGFLGMKQDPITLSIKPIIGWFITTRSTRYNFLDEKKRRFMIEDWN